MVKETGYGCRVAGRLVRYCDIGPKAPAAVGVPETTPAELNDRPAGKRGATGRSPGIGGTPPVACQLEVISSSYGADARLSSW